MRPELSYRPSRSDWHLRDLRPGDPGPYEQAAVLLVVFAVFLLGLAYALGGCTDVVVVGPTEGEGGAGGCPASVYLQAGLWS